MKIIKRFVFGILSSALLAVGLAQAANRFDPMTRSLPPADAQINSLAPDSQSECWIDLNNT